MNIVEINRENWEAYLSLKVRDDQKAFVPSPAEAMAAAYVKPWDEALDVYGLYKDRPVGMFYISYTPKSLDNYWLGGFFVDEKYQGKGYGREGLETIIEWFRMNFIEAEELWLTVESENIVAKKLYTSFGFEPVGQVNKYGEEKYRLKICK